MTQQWKPIESAPKNQLVMVYTPPQPSDWPDSVRIGFDYIDPEVADDYWYNHGEHYEHYCCVAKPENCTGPQERAPYTHWMPLPDAPCQTCNGHGMVGGLTPHSGYDAAPCPDCTPPASAQDDAKDERQAFEKSGITERLYRNTEPGYTDEYQDAYTQFAWRGWQARAALEGLK